MNWPKGKKLITMHKAFHPRDEIDYKCQEKKEKEDTPPLKIAREHQSEDSKIPF